MKQFRIPSFEIRLSPTAKTDLVANFVELGYVETCSEQPTRHSIVLSQCIALLYHTSGLFFSLECIFICRTQV